MVTQPAYLKNLKTYARTQFGDADQSEAIIADFDAESDRGAIILAATGIEDTIEFRLGLMMPVLEKDASARAEVFGARGCMGTYADKILMAYALGIIDERGRRDIDLVREIRNACAHCRLPISLSVPELQAAVKAALGPEMLREIKDHEPRTLRVAFIVHCATVVGYVATGKRRSPTETAEAYAQGELLASSGRRA